jgi:hypothetical protein
VIGIVRNGGEVGIRTLDTALGLSLVTIFCSGAAGQSHIQPTKREHAEMRREFYMGLQMNGDRRMKSSPTALA